MKKATILITLILVVSFAVFYEPPKSSANNTEILIQEVALDDLENTDTEMYGIFAPYNDQTLEMAKEGKTILFFDAPWCLTCKDFVVDVKKNLTQIPADVFILYVDYDSTLDLRNKYGVAQPHTFVLIDSQDKVIKKWNNILMLESLLTQVK